MKFQKINNTEFKKIRTEVIEETYNIQQLISDREILLQDLKIIEDLIVEAEKLGIATNVKEQTI